MDRTADLDSALSFVIGRIAEQATVSGKPLSDEQRLLLNYLPSETPANWDPEFPVLVPRNINLERVCALGKAAYLHDLQLIATGLVPIVAVVLLVWNADGPLFLSVAIGSGCIAIIGCS